MGWGIKGEECNRIGALPPLTEEDRHQGFIGVVLFIYGLVVLHLWLTILGGAVMMISKLWYADRVVWLYEDMKNATPKYKSWLY